MDPRTLPGANYGEPGNPQEREARPTILPMPRQARDGRAVGGMKEATGRIGQTITGLDATNKSLGRTNAKFDETNARLGVIDQAIQKIPIIRQ